MSYRQWSPVEPAALEGDADEPTREPEDVEPRMETVAATGKGNKALRLAALLLARPLSRRTFTAIVLLPSAASMVRERNAS
eukprot:5516069-Amphidinium_carterae.2